MLHSVLKNLAAVLGNLNPQASELKAEINVKAHKEIIQLSTVPWIG